MYLIRAFPNVIILLICNMYKNVSFSNQGFHHARHTVKENECHTARFPVRRFDCFDHLYKGILKQMIPHLKALIFSY